jgi:hypothetical protein
LAVGCGGSNEEKAKAPPSDVLPLNIEHEACDTNSSSAQKVDTNGDGVPDIIRVQSDGREICRMVDLNHDAHPDSYIYFDGSGRVRRRESDFDRDGHIDEIAYYVNGVPVRKDRETNLDGRLDTWDFYENGKIHHRMRDSDADGKVDQWWTWPDPDKIECAVIASDHNGDGRPDLNDVIDVCNPSGPGGADGGASAQGATTALVDGGAAPAIGATAAALAAAPMRDAAAAPMPAVASATSTPDAGERKASTSSKKATGKGAAK